jgi:hypothetical protein
MVNLEKLPMKKQPLDLTPPRWAKKMIIELARDAGMTPDGVYAMVIKLGVEAASSLLEDQINLIASLREGPIDEPNIESNDGPEQAGAPLAQEPEVLNPPIESLNGSAVAYHQEAREGPDDAGERREEPPASPENDFVDALATGPREGIEEKREAGENDEIRDLSTGG